MNTATITTRDVPVFLDNVGTVVSSITLTVRAQVKGTLASVNVEEGRVVAYGDLLATVDDRVLRGQIAAAEGALLRDRTQLDDDRRALERIRKLVGIGLASHPQLDSLTTEIQETEDIVKARARALEGLHTQLDHTRITAPMDGVVGPWAVAPGDFVQPGHVSGVVTLGLLSDQFANASVHVQTLHDALVVPLVAIRYRNQGAYVFVVGEGEVRLQKVRTGPTLDNYCVIDADTLKPGMLVAVDSNQPLEDGAAVRVIAPAQTAH